MTYPINNAQLSINAIEKEIQLIDNGLSVDTSMWDKDVMLFVVYQENQYNDTDELFINNVPVCSMNGTTRELFDEGLLQIVENTKVLEVVKQWDGKYGG